MPIDVQRHGLAGDLNDKVELERIEVLLRGGADLARRRDELRAFKERSRLRVLCEVEHVLSERQRSTDERLVWLAQPVDTARHDEVPPDVNASSEMAQRAVARRNKKRMIAPPICADRSRLTNVLVRRRVRVQIVNVRRVAFAPHRFHQRSQRLRRGL